MSLRHALLAVLTAEPMTGYDLVRYFDGTVAFLWNAPHSQIYPELRKMEAHGLVEADEVKRGERAIKRLYRISEQGIIELRAWAAELLPLQPERDAYRLKAAYFEWGSYETARRQLIEHLNHYRRYLSQWEQEIDDIESKRLPLLQKRLESRPDEEAEAIIAFKRFAFRGELARARAEIAWAEEGLALVDQLERTGVQLSQQAHIEPSIVS